MRKSLEALTDRGCWIADDRIYAFITAAGGISELGYHGTQPVSRNSRILVRPSGIFLFSYRVAGGEERGLVFSLVEWYPGHLVATIPVAEGRLEITVRASGRQVCVEWKGSVSAAGVLLVRVWKESCFTDVHGKREWAPARVQGNSVFLGCRDTIRLQSWISRTGAYAGDFMIPEVWRRVLFARHVRSGMARREDLRLEFRDANPALYDAPVAVSFGGRGFTLTDERLTWAFEHSFTAGSPIGARFVITCGESHSGGNDLPVPLPPSVESSGGTGPPLLSLAGYPSWGSFYESVPGLMDSCRVRDLGVPRACPGRYYWLWAWDMLVAAAEGARWGDGGLGESVARFVDGHRDTNGVIPARWTRSLLPLDTPSPGGIEFLYGALAYENFLESGNVDELLHATRRLRTLFLQVSHGVPEKGFIQGEGFYPDLLAAFGRSKESAVSMETGSWYTLCRIMQNIAALTGDESTRQFAETCAAAIAKDFLGSFWDDRSGFFLDAVDPATGKRSTHHPLFALLFLHSSQGLSLLRGRMQDAARFIADRFLSEHGIRPIPLAESGPGGETVLDSWYPHWDLYALKLLRRGGDAGGIMRWLRRSEEALTRLGYCPEYLALGGFRDGDADPWVHHGAASNLNCVTGWYRAAREIICGIECDPGGLTHIPLALPVGRVVLRDVRWRGGHWTIEIRYDGPYFQDMEANGAAIEGSLKVPIRYAVPGRHYLRVRYGDERPAAYFGELVNAEILATSRTGGGPSVEVNGLGYVDGTFFSPVPAVVLLDGKEIGSTWETASGDGFFGLTLYGPHTLRLAPRTPETQEGD